MSSAPFSPTWIALSREAGIAGQSVSAGLTALRKANYAQEGLYSHAFFSLSIGLERMLKLIFLLDHKAQNGTFPSEADMRNRFGHDLEKLFAYAQQVHARLPKPEERYPLTMYEIAAHVIPFLSKFAVATRYYNLDFLVGGKRSGKFNDPISEWFTDIGGRILQKHYSPKRRARDEAFARGVGKLIGDSMFVRHTAEDGTPLESFEAASMQTGKVQVVQKYGTFYCAVVARFLYMLIYDLVHEANGKPWRADIPYLTELFFPFLNDDPYLLSIKTFPPQGQ